MVKYLSILLLSINTIFGSIVGNPSSIRIFEKGLFFKDKAVNLRGGYYFTNMYQMHFEDRILTDDSTDSFVKLVTQGAMITANIKKWVDVYVLLGESRLKIKDDGSSDMSFRFKTNNDLCWATGLRVLLFKLANFNCAISGSYFQSQMDTSDILLNKQIYPIVTEKFGFLYEEYQTALALSYKIKNLIPYLGLTYLISNTITTKPIEKNLMRLPFPNQDELSDLIFSNTKNSKSWGMIAGVSLISEDMIDLTLETRLFDQNAFNISSEIRF